ncbi:MAG: sulfur carrier protein ThiS [Proteobacteria bacterium]|nr:sulfur carrier protein ThiS [Pseudomonadota bacterium]
MRLIVNGKEICLDREMSIVEFLHSRGIVEAMVAVEHNLSWTRREEWPNITLKENDRVEVIQIMAGG